MLMIFQVAALYLIEPTTENIKYILQDVNNDLYDELYIIFLSFSTRSHLEQLAEGIVRLKKTDKIKKIYDQYLSFISLEKNLFSLGISKSFMSLNSHLLKDNEMEVELCKRYRDKHIYKIKFQKQIS